MPGPWPEAAPRPLDRGARWRVTRAGRGLRGSFRDRFFFSFRQAIGPRRQAHLIPTDEGRAPRTEWLSSRVGRPCLFDVSLSMSFPPSVQRAIDVSKLVSDARG